MQFCSHFKLALTHSICWSPPSCSRQDTNNIDPSPGLDPLGEHEVLVDHVVPKSPQLGRYIGQTLVIIFWTFIVSRFRQKIFEDIFYQLTTDFVLFEMRKFCFKCGSRNIVLGHYVVIVKVKLCGHFVKFIRIRVIPLLDNSIFLKIIIQMMEEMFNHIST